MKVMLAPTAIDEIVMLTKYGMQRMPDPSALVPLTAWK